MEFVYRSEFGSSMPVNFLDPSQIKCYDGEGKEIVIPKCDKCNFHKTQVIGKESFTWICNSCGGQ